MSKHGFDLDMWAQEAKVRGLFLSIACEAEFFFDRITSKCEEDDGSKRESLKLQFPFDPNFASSFLKSPKSFIEKHLRHLLDSPN